MPQDPNLYGQAPPRKKQKKELSLPGSLTFTSQLSSLLASTTNSSSSSPTVGTSTARPRPSKSKTSELFNVKVKRKNPTANDDASEEIKSDNQKNKLNLKQPLSTEDEKAEFERARRKMESKARLYAAMQRGDYIGKEIGLVDFDRKWAEKQQGRPDGYSSSSGDDSSDSEKEEGGKEKLVEYTDEFGRIRMVTPAQRARMEARVARGQASALELEVMSGRPVKAPANLIFGDAIQSEAFQAQDAAKMEELARKRDRSATPPPATHYEADKEIRTKGVGFFAFSKDEEERMKQMEELERKREETERVRAERAEKEGKRRKDIEERRRMLDERRKVAGEKRARMMADSFLDGLAREDGILPLDSSLNQDERGKPERSAGGGGGGGGDKR